MYDKKYLFALTAALALSLASCASFPEPENEGSTLVMGKLDFSLKGTMMMSDALARITVGDISMVLENKKTRERFFLGTDMGGNFKTTGIPAGRYALSRIDVSINQGGESFKLSGYLERKLYFDIAAGAVSNLGLLDWTMVLDGMGQVDEQVLLTKDEFDGIFSSAKKRAPKSQWWARPVNNVTLYEVSETGKSQDAL